MLRALQFNIENRKFDRIFVFIFLEKKNFLKLKMIIRPLKLFFSDTICTLNLKY